MESIFIFNAPRCLALRFFNYKHTFSTLVLAMCDYKFTYVNIGSAGREGDAGVFGQSKLYHSLECNSLHIPPPCLVNGTDVELPYVIVGDEAFPMKKYLMRPYPGRGKNVLPHIQQIFNYRLSRARRFIENCFGILVARWRIFSHPIMQKLKIVSPTSKQLWSYITICVQKNLINTLHVTLLIPKIWMVHLCQADGDKKKLYAHFVHTRSVAELRDNIADFFVSPQGSVSWQNHMVGNT